MAHEQHTDKSPAELADRVWELAKKIRICMFVTWDGERQQQRPLASMPDRDAGVIRFLVSAEGSKAWQVERYPEVSLGYADNGGSNYVAIAGTAVMSHDRAMIEELWSPFAKAWWDSPDDPDIRVLTVTPERAELWDGPNRMLAAAVMLATAMTGRNADMGEHGSVRM
jgi:general stress protein 26